ncbi:MAG: S41 family peptidase [Acidobacteria bacterium]|nr:MAG: S41 family peptidase [Acidobacteriota bacterium]
MKNRFGAFVILVVVMSSLVGGLMGGNTAAVGASNPTSANEFLKTFSEALDLIQKNYVDNIGPDKLVYSAVKGMLRSLDPHSSFFEPKEFSRQREEQHSKYYGLGIRVRPLLRERGRVVIVEPPVTGSPAERRGLRAGDVITKIEGESIDEWTSEEVVGHLRGPRGTTVNITVERPGIRDPLPFRVERDEIPIITVPYAFELKPGVGYIKLERFSESTADELGQKLKALNTKNLNGLILDLRDNPGGLLNAAIDVSDYFVPKNEMVVSTKGRIESSARSYKAPSLEKYRVPLVVLINRHSASASEIVAGSLQDHDLALIVGETSFGKGLVQSVYNLDNGTGMALTTAHYFTPSGRLIQRDYSGSSFDYYYLASVLKPSTKEREIKYTDSGRKVLGGGGITPDLAVPMRELDRFEALLQSRDIFFEYARRLTSGQVPAASSFRLPLKTDEVASANPEKSSKPIPKLEITDAILEDFKEFLRSRKVEFTDVDIQTNVEFIKRRIKQEVYTSSFGLQEGFKVGVSGDTQVMKALELLPEARQLMTTGRATIPAAQNPEVK